MKKISILLLLLSSLPFLNGCLFGGGSSSTSVSHVRLVNATSDTLDMVSSSTTLASSVAAATASSFADLSSGTQSIQLVDSTTSVPTFTTSYSFSSSVYYSLLSYTSGGSIHVAALTENEDDPTSGYGKFRVADYASDAGSVDIYVAVQGTTNSLSNATLLASSITGTTSYFELAKNTYHIWVTGADDKTDVRLEVDSVTLSNQQILTLVLTGTTGGALVDGLLITQKGTVVAETNTNVRVRIVADVASSGTVSSAYANNVSLLGTSTSMTSPSLGSYTLVPAGALTITVNGSSACAGNTATAGSDLTLIYAGTAASPQCFLINDDNTLPSSGYTKLRLVHGINSLSSNLSLTDNAVTIASNVAFGATSTAKTLTSGISSYLAVNVNLFTLSNVTLNSKGVYTLFMLGDTSTNTGYLSQDR